MTVRMDLRMLRGKVAYGLDLIREFMRPGGR